MTVQSAISADAAFTSQPSTSAAARRQIHVADDVQFKSVAIITESSSLQTATLFDVADDLALSTSTSRSASDAGSSDNMFVDITDDEVAAGFEWIRDDLLREYR